MAGTTIETLEGSLRDGDGVALVRPEAVHVTPDQKGNGVVRNTSFLGAISRVTVELDEGGSVVSQVPRSMVENVSTGDRVEVTLDAVPVLVVSD